MSNDRLEISFENLLQQSYLCIATSKVFENTDAQLQSVGPPRLQLQIIGFGASYPQLLSSWHCRAVDVRKIFGGEMRSRQLEMSSVYAEDERLLISPPAQLSGMLHHLP